MCLLLVIVIVVVLSLSLVHHFPYSFFCTCPLFLQHQFSFKHPSYFPQYPYPKLTPSLFLFYLQIFILFILISSFTYNFLVISISFHFFLCLSTYYPFNPKLKQQHFHIPSFDIILIFVIFSTSSSLFPLPPTIYTYSFFLFASSVSPNQSNHLPLSTFEDSS